MTKERRLGFRFIPKIAQPGSNEPRERKIENLEKFLACEDCQITIADMREFSVIASSYVQRTKAMIAKYNQLKSDHRLTPDERKAAKLLRYINEMVGALKVPVFSSRSLNLLSLYQAGVRDIAVLFSDDYFNRPFERTLNLFLEIEPGFTIICSRCDIVSAADNVEGILRGASSQSTARIEEGKGSGASHYCDFYGRPFKSEEDKWKGMEEAGTAGVYADLRNEEGFSNYAADFQDQVDLWTSVAKFAWSPAPPSAKKEHEEAMKEFRKLNELLTYEFKKYIIEEGTLLNRTKEDDDRASAGRTRQCIFLHLIDLNERFSKVIIEKNIIGLYALASSVRNWTGEFLYEDFFKKEGFFERTIDDLTVNYLRAEPMFIALSKLCEMKIPSLNEGIRHFDKKAYEIIDGLLPDVKKHYEGQKRNK